LTTALGSPHAFCRRPSMLDTLFVGNWGPAAGAAITVSSSVMFGPGCRRSWPSPLGQPLWVPALLGFRKTKRLTITAHDSTFCGTVLYYPSSGYSHLSHAPLSVSRLLQHESLGYGEKSFTLPLNLLADAGKYLRVSISAMTSVSTPPPCYSQWCFRGLGRLRLVPLGIPRRRNTLHISLNMS